MLNCLVLDPLCNLLQFNSTSIRKEACWAISNIAAGNRIQIEQLIMHPTIIPNLIHVASYDKFSVRKEALWAFCNMINGASKKQEIFLLSKNVLIPLCQALSCDDKNCIQCCLEGLEILLTVIQENEDYHEEAIKMIINQGGYDYLIELSQKYVKDNVIIEIFDQLHQHFFGYTIKNERKRILNYK